MSEANKNDTPFDSQAPQFESGGEINNTDVTNLSQSVTQPTSQSESVELPRENSTSNPDTIAAEKTTCSSNQKMDWQKVAHKLREHNRKLLKKVFQLEQDLADIDNKLTQQIEKSYSSDLLAAQQATEIKDYQEKVASITQDLESFQQQNHNQKVEIESLSKQLELSQKHAAQLERECALLQENYNQKTYELITTGQKAQELHSRLSRQQRYTLQYKAALDQHLNQVTTVDLNSDTEVKDNLAQVKPKPIQAWSIPTSRKEISLPQAKSLSLATNSASENQIEVKKPASKITEWPAPEIAKVNKNKKPKSLAAIDLPRFPRRS